MQHIARECEYCGEISRPLILGYCYDCSHDLTDALKVAIDALPYNGSGKNAAILGNLAGTVQLLRAGRGVRAGAATPKEEA